MTGPSNRWPEVEVLGSLGVSMDGDGWASARLVAARLKIVLSCVSRPKGTATTVPGTAGRRQGRRVSELERDAR